MYSLQIVMATRPSYPLRRLSDERTLILSVDELKELMEFRGAEAAKQLQDQYGGVERLCDLLNTSPTEGRSLEGLNPLTPTVVNIVISIYSYKAYCGRPGYAVVCNF